ncbi:hypothetical protein [Legionella sp. WA2024007413]
MKSNGSFNINILITGSSTGPNRVNQYGALTQEHILSPDPRTPFKHKFEESFSECSNNLPKELIEN